MAKSMSRAQKRELIEFMRSRFECNGNCILNSHEWKELAKHFNLPNAEAAKKAWRSLKDRFVRLYKRSVKDPDEEIDWKFFDSMMFLRNGKIEDITDTEEHAMGTPVSPSITEIVSANPTPIVLSIASQSLEAKRGDTLPMVPAQYFQLIKEVRKEPLLYKESHRKPTPTTVEIWERIANLCAFPNGKAAKIKYKMLRDDYRRALRKHTVEKSPFQKLYKEMSLLFQGEYLNDRAGITNELRQHDYWQRE